jgi:hypothetical protein
MLTFSIAGIIAVVSGAGSLFARHIWNKVRANPLGVAADAASLAAAMKAASEDRRITSSELSDLAKKADSLASKLK